MLLAEPVPTWFGQPAVESRPERRLRAVR